MGKNHVVQVSVSFPRPECDAFRLHDPAKAKARNRRLYDLPRTSDEISINDYNASC